MYTSSISGLVVSTGWIIASFPNKWNGNDSLNSDYLLKYLALSSMDQGRLQ